MSVNRMEVGDEDLDRFPIPGPKDGLPILGEAGVASSLIVGKPRWCDGFAVNFTTAFIRTDRAAIGEAMGIKTKPGTSPEWQIPSILLSIPDYQAEDAVTYVLGFSDAKRLVAILEDFIRQGEQVYERELRIEAARNERTNAEARVRAVADEVTRCAEAGCSRQRSFFDSDGVGYCKRHAHERGLHRPGRG